MSRIVFLFPGQASQYVGMGEDLFRKFSEVRELYKKASEILEYDLAKVSFEGPEELLIQTKYTQPAVFVHSLALWQLLEKQGIKPAFVSGHSLGEYSAAVCAGFFKTFKQGLWAVQDRSMLMQLACEKEKGTMAVIIGLSWDKVSEICQQASSEGVVQPANFNAADQVVISGSLSGVKKAMELAEEAGAKIVKELPVGGAYHSPLMVSARNGMAETLNLINIRKAKVPLVANVTGRPVSDHREFKKLLVEQMTSPVLWHQSMEYLYDKEGIKDFVEIGPGKVLQGLLKRSFADINLYGIDKLPELEKFIDEHKQN